jgi:AcrR family transcriptional regulator
MASDNTRERLLEAAAVEIARVGLKGASLREIAARAEIRAASIFHFFPGGKDELARAVLENIMATIATRMTPTIASAAGAQPADLVVDCAGLFWDYLAEHPECAGVLMREAFAPDEALAPLVQGHGQRVVKLAMQFIQGAQSAGLLAKFNVRRFLMRVASYTVTFHAAGSMRRYIMGANWSVKAERAAFLATVRAEVTGGGAGDRAV